MENHLYQQYIDTPLGCMTAIASEYALHELFFNDSSRWQSITCAQAVIKKEHNLLLYNLQQQLNAYFKGELQAFTIPLSLHGTEFQRKVWDTLQKVPFGQTASYKSIALSMDKPKAYRAVALANRSNPIAIVVPCHRIIRYNGALCGYNAGIERKQWLLAHENAI